MGSGKFIMGKVDDLCPKIHATVILFRKLEMTNCMKAYFICYVPSAEKLAKIFLVNEGPSKCLKKENHDLIFGQRTSISLIMSME